MRVVSIRDLPQPPNGKTGWPWTAESGREGMDGTWPVISIVTPNYNYGRYLEAAIRSVLLQGYPKLEYIVMDGGSTDESVEILERYGEFLTEWVSEKDAGQTAAVQAGFERSTGEIMAWLNSDDMYLPGALRTVAEIFRAFPEIEWLTTSMVANWDEAGLLRGIAPAVEGFTRAWFFRGWHVRCWGRKRPYKQTIQQEATFWRRSLWERAGGRLDLSLRDAADFELWARFWRHAELATVNVPLGGFRRHPAQKTADWERYCGEVERVLKRHSGGLRAAVRWVWERSAVRRIKVFYDFQNGCWKKLEQVVR